MEQRMDQCHNRALKTSFWARWRRAFIILTMQIIFSQANSKLSSLELQMLIIWISKSTISLPKLGRREKASELMLNRSWRIIEGRLMNNILRFSCIFRIKFQFSGILCLLNIRYLKVLQRQSHKMLGPLMTDSAEVILLIQSWTNQLTSSSNYRWMLS